MSAILLLNTHPIRAVLLSESDQVIETLARELQVSIQEEMQRKDWQGDGLFPFPFTVANCEELLKRLENDVTSAKSLWSNIKNTSEGDMQVKLQELQLIKKLNEIRKTMESGSEGNCSWVSCVSTSASTTINCSTSFADMQEMLNDARERHPCDEQFQKQVLLQSEITVEAISVFFTEDCSVLNAAEAGVKDLAVGVDTSSAVAVKGANSLMDVTDHSMAVVPGVLFQIVAFVLLFLLVVFMVLCLTSAIRMFWGITVCLVSKIISIFTGGKVSFRECWSELVDTTPVVVNCLQAAIIRVMFRR